MLAGVLLGTAAVLFSIGYSVSVIRDRYLDNEAKALCVGLVAMVWGILFIFSIPALTGIGAAH